MAEPGRRRSPLEKAWQNLIIRTVAYYALLLGAAAILLRQFPTQVAVLTRDLSGERSVEGAAGPGALGDVLTGPVFGAWGSNDYISASVSMIVAGLFALPVAWIYILIRRKKGFRQSLVHSLVLLPVVVAGVVVLVKNSLALAFSLAGIVAAVRFRNTLEDSKDAVYIFVATGIGLAAGVDLPVAGVLSIIFNIVAVALWYADLGRSSAALEGTIAERRLRDARAHVDRPSGFVQRLDDEVLKSMSADQLDALAVRARRRRKRHAPSGEFDMFDCQVRVRTTDVNATMQQVQAVLPGYGKRWKMGEVLPGRDGTHVIDFAVQLKKSAAPKALQERGGAGILDVEVR